MREELVIDSCISVRADCPISATVTDDQVEVSIGRHHRGCSLAFEPAALREFVRVAADALDEIVALDPELIGVGRAG